MKPRLIRLSAGPMLARATGAPWGVGLAGPAGPSVEEDLRAALAVEETAQVEAGERIGRVRAHERREGRERGGITRGELLEGGGISPPGRGFEPLLRKRLVSAQRLAEAPQQQVAGRAALEARNPRGHGRAGADARAEGLVRGLEARGGVDGVPVRRVVEVPPAPEVADEGRAGMQADAGRAERDGPGPPPGAEHLREG